MIQRGIALIALAAALANPAGPAAGPAAHIRVDTAGSAIAVNPRLFATNAAMWLGRDRLNDATFRARTAASGAGAIRIPGGSWSNGYAWRPCETGEAEVNGRECWFGFDSWLAAPRDWINFLRAVGKPAIYTVDLAGTAREAAALVAYFNGAITDTRPIGVDPRGTDWRTVGYWAQLRAARGNPQPLGIQLWEVGNEIYGGKAGSGADCGPWGWEDHVWTCDGGEYVNGIGSGSARREGYLEFRDAMRAVDPSIQVGAVGVDRIGDWSGWAEEVIGAAGANLDWYVLHPYPFWDPPTVDELLANPQSHLPGIRERMTEAFDAHAGGRRAPIGVTEFNVTAADSQDIAQLMTRLSGALFMADTVGQAIQHGFLALNQWVLASGYAASGTNYGLMEADTWFRLPQYFVYPLWSRFGGQMIPVTSTLSAATQLSVYAGRVNSSTLSLLAINKTGEAIAATIELAGAPAISGGSADVLRGASHASREVTFNNLADAGSAAADDLSNAPPLALGGGGNPLAYTFAPYSVTLLRLSRAPPGVSPRAFVPRVQHGE
jgi:hypothetical protein